MSRLHGGDYPELGKARDVHRTNHLSVLDPETMIRHGYSFQRGLERVQRDAIASITNRVNVHLETTPQRRVRPGANVLRPRNEQAGIGWLVAVGREQCRAARAEGAIGVELESPDPEVPIV